MSKSRIRRSFGRAAASYDSAAGLQRRVCELLLSVLPDISPAAILDAGCGTGHALGLLAGRWPVAKLVAADFSPPMLVAAGGGVCADIEALPFPAASFDLYWSNLTVQWCDLPRTLAEAARVLAPGGRLAISSLATGTLAELRDAFAGTDRHRHVLDFSPPDNLPATCAAVGLSVIEWHAHTLRLHQPTLADLLRELKALGANEVGPGRRRGLLGRKTWLTVEQRYERHRDADGLPATYEVILCTARKPAS